MDHRTFIGRPNGEHGGIMLPVILGILIIGAFATASVPWFLDHHGDKREQLLKVRQNAARIAQQSRNQSNGFPLGVTSQQEMQDLVGLIMELGTTDSGRGECAGPQSLSGSDLVRKTLGDR